MQDIIKLIVEVFQKATVNVINQTLPSEGKWRIKYNTGILSDWKSNNTNIKIDSGLYEIEFNEIDGYNKPNNYSFFVKPGELKKINVVYTKRKTAKLQISFKLPEEYQKYLNWRIIQLPDRTVVDWNHETFFSQKLVQGNYQLQIEEYISDSVAQDIIIYDYLTGDEIEEKYFYIKGEEVDIELINPVTLNYEYSKITNTTTINSTANVCVTISPDSFRDITQWRLTSPEYTSLWFDSGKTINIPFGTYFIETTPVSGWYVNNNESIVINSDKELFLIGITGEIYGNLRIKLNGDAIKNDARWRPVGSSIWYMDNEEISLFPNSYEIEFLAVENYATPENQNYYVEENSVLVETVEYVSLGSLQVNIESNLLLESIDTPLWKIKNISSWYNSGQIVYLEEGEYIIEFNTVGNIFTHENITIEISNEETIVKDISFVGVSLLAIPTKNDITFYNFNNLSKVEILTSLKSFENTNQVRFNHNDTLLAICHNDIPYLSIYNIIDFTFYNEALFIPPLGGCRSLDFSNDGKYLAVSHNNFPYLTIYNTIDWSKVTPTVLPNGYCNTVKFSDDSTYLAVGFENDPYLIIYETVSFTSVWVPFILESEVFSCKFNNTNNLLAIGLNNDFKIIDLMDSNNLVDISTNISGTIFGVDFVNNFIIVISSLYFYIYHYDNDSGNYILNNQIPSPVANINNYIEVSNNQEYIIIGCVNQPYFLIYETTNWTRVDFNYNLTSYCKKFDISGDLSQREYVKTPINIYPINEYRGLRSFEELESSEFACFSLTYNLSGSDIGLDNHIKSQWRLFNNDMEIVYDSDESDDLTTHLLPSSFFDESNTYKWQVRYKGENFGWSFWSEPTSFITMYSFVETPTNVLPIDEAVNVVEQPTLTSSVFTVVNASDTHMFSEWRITDSNDRVRYVSGAITDLTSHIVPLGLLNGSSVYYWKVRYKAESLGWSDWSVATSFTTAAWNVVKPTNTAPYNGETNIDEENITLISTEFETSNTDDTHTHTRYEIYRVSNNTLVYTSGEIQDTRLDTDIEFSLPVNIVADGTIEYKWRVAYKGYNLGWSEWSNFTTFTTRILQVSNVLVDIYPTEILPGRSIPLRWKWRSLTSTIFSDYILPSTTIQIEAGQSILIDFEDYIGLIKPSPITINNLVAGDSYSYTATYGVYFGSIQCNINGPGQWRIKDTLIWRDSGYIESSLVFSVYEIEFKPITGYITPENITNIAVISNELIVKSATYIIDDSQTYYIVVVVNENQQWKLHSSNTWNNSGDRVSLFGIETEYVEFTELEGFITPNIISLQIPDSYIEYPSYQHPSLPKTLYFEKQYIPIDLGYFNCKTVPSYAKWKILVDNIWSDWYDSDTTLDLKSGTYRVQFQEIGGYESPNDVEVIINNNLTTTLTEYYILEEDVGHLKVSISVPSSGWRVKNTLDWNQTDVILDLKIGTYTIEFKPVEGFVTPNDKIAIVTKDKLTYILQKYEYTTTSNLKYIKINVNGIDYKNILLSYRVNYSTDSTTWTNWTDWSEYYPVGPDNKRYVNDKLFSPMLGYYKFEFKTISIYRPLQPIKTVQYKGINTEVSFDYSTNISVYNNVNTSIDLVDDNLRPISSNTLSQLIELKYGNISDNDFNNKDASKVNWSSWIKYLDFNTVLSKSLKYAFKIKPLNNYFNLGDYGNISYLSYNNNSNTFDLNLKYINYDINELYFEIPLLNVPEEYAVYDISDFNIKIRTKSEFEDVYSSSKNITIYGNVLLHNIGNVNYKVFRSRKYTFRELFGCDQIGFISIENFSVNELQSNFDVNMQPYNNSLNIYLGGFCIPAYLKYR